MFSGWVPFALKSKSAFLKSGSEKKSHPPEDKLTICGLNGLPSRRHIAGFKFSDQFMFISSADEKGEVDYGKRLLVCAGQGQSREIVLSQPCNYARKITNDLMVCGGVKHLAVVNLASDQEVEVLALPDHSLRQSSVRTLSDGSIRLVCTDMGKMIYYVLKCNNQEIISYGISQSEGPITSLCDSLYPDEFLISEGEVSKICAITAERILQKNTIHFGLPNSMTLGKLYPPVVDTCVVPRPYGGYIFRDRNSHYIAVKNEEGETVANWLPPKNIKKPGNQFEISALQVLCDGDTVLVNFADCNNLKKVGVFKIPSLSSDTKFIQSMPLEFYEVPFEIEQLILDEQNSQLVVLTRQGTVVTLPKFKPMMEALQNHAQKEQNMRDIIGLTAFNTPDLITLTQQYCRR